MTTNLDILEAAMWPNGFSTFDGAFLDKMLMQIVQPLQPLKFVPDTTRTLTATDNGFMLMFTNPAGCTLTVPSGLSVQLNCAIAQLGAAQVTITAGSGATILNAGSFTKTAAQGAVCSLVVYGNNAANTAAQALTFGNMA